MKILMTLESPFPPDTRVENEIEALTAAGHTVHLLCYRRSGEPLSDRLNSAIIHRIDPSSLVIKSSVGALRFPLYFHFWKKEIIKILATDTFDIVHIHDLPLIKPVSELKKRFGFKIILDLHENWPGLLAMSLHTKTIAGRLLSNINEWKKYEAKYIPEADGVIVVVEEALQRIKPYLTGSQISSIVSNTINLKEFRSFEITKTPPVGKVIFIYEGGITFHRGLQNVIKALSLIKTDTKWELRVAGSGSFLPELKTQADELGLSKRVKFLGWQPIGEIYNLLSNATIAIIPHLKSEHTDNTIPHKLFHYIYSGLPVLSSDCNPLKRVVMETGSGMVYSSNNIEELSGLLQDIVDSPGTLEKYSLSQSWIESKYNWENDAKNLINIYRNLNE